MLAHMQCLEEAAKRLKLPYEFLDAHHNFIRIGNTQPLFFSGTTAPFNDEHVAKVCRDKEYAYLLLHNALRVPKSRGFLDPECREEYRRYAPFASMEAIATEIVNDFQLPVIVKRNAGARGQHVFLAASETDVCTALQTIYDKNSSLYDFVALAQERVDIAREYRVVVFRGEIMLAYAKDISNARFTGNLSPLHWDNARAIPVTDPSLIARFREFVAPMFTKLDLRFGGLDIAEDHAGILWLLEANTKPGFSLFIRDNGPDAIIALYEKILSLSATAAP